MVFSASPKLPPSIGQYLICMRISIEFHFAGTVSGLLSEGKDGGLLAIRGTVVQLRCQSVVRVLRYRKPVLFENDSKVFV